MAIFDDNVRAVLEYAAAIGNPDVKRELLVCLVRDKALYGGVDLIDLFYPNAYAGLRDETDACNYLLSVPLLKKLYDVASARGREHSVRFEGRPNAEGLEKIKRRIESFA